MGAAAKAPPTGVAVPVPAGVEEPQLPLCEECRDDQPQKTILTLRSKVQKAERRAKDLERICRSCANLAWDEKVKCDSRDCAVFYSRVKANTQLGVVRNGIGRVLDALQDEEAQYEELEW